MKLPEDFKEFIELLNKHKVRYLIVGGYAISFHSRPRFTNDLDIWIDQSSKNAEKILTVLEEFGFGEIDITKDDLTTPNMIIQLGYAPLRIDIITSVSGVEFQEAYRKKTEGSYMGVKSFFISMEDIIKNKEATGREKDLEDLKWIRKYAKRK